MAVPVQGGPQPSAGEIRKNRRGMREKYPGWKPGQPLPVTPNESGQAGPAKPMGNVLKGRGGRSLEVDPKVWDTIPEAMRPGIQKVLAQQGRGGLRDVVAHQPWGKALMGALGGPRGAEQNRPGARPATEMGPKQSSGRVPYLPAVGDRGPVSRGGLPTGGAGGGGLPPSAETVPDGGAERNPYGSVEEAKKRAAMGQYVDPKWLTEGGFDTLGGNVGTGQPAPLGSLKPGLPPSGGPMMDPTQVVPGSKGAPDTNPRGVPGQAPAPTPIGGSAEGGPEGGGGVGGGAQSPYLTMQGGKGGYSVDEWNGLKSFIATQPPQIQQQIMAGIDAVPGQGGQKFDYLLGQIKKFAGGGAGASSEGIPPMPPQGGEIKPGTGGGGGVPTTPPGQPRPDAGVPAGGIVNNWKPSDPAWVASIEQKFGPGTVQRVQQAMNEAVAGIPEDGSGRRRALIYGVLQRFGLASGGGGVGPNPQGPPGQTGGGGVPGMPPMGGGGGTITPQILTGTGNVNPQLNPAVVDPYSNQQNPLGGGNIFTPL